MKAPTPTDGGANPHGWRRQPPRTLSRGVLMSSRPRRHCTSPRLSHGSCLPGALHHLLSHGSCLPGALHHLLSHGSCLPVALHLRRPARAPALRPDLSVAARSARRDASGGASSVGVSSVASLLMRPCRGRRLARRLAPRRLVRRLARRLAPRRLVRRLARRSGLDPPLRGQLTATERCPR